MPEPWLKLDTSLVANPKVMTLPGDAFKAWVCILCETKRYNQGDLVPPTPRLSFTLHLKLEAMVPIIERLADAGLLDWDVSVNAYRVHDWDDWQRRYPSDSKEAQNERQRRSRVARKGLGNGGLDPNTEDKPPNMAAYPRANAVTSSHDNGVVTPTASHVTTGHGGHDSRLEKTREEEIRGEGDTPPVTPPRASRTRGDRGTRIPADWPLTEELLQHGLEQGIDAEAIAWWHDSFHVHFRQTTRNPTSLNWVFREKSRMTTDIREGRLAPSKSRQTPPSRAQTPIIPQDAAGIAELTPAEETYREFVAWRERDGNEDDLSEGARQVIGVFGGADAIWDRAPPSFPEWVAASKRVVGGLGRGLL